MAKHTIENKEIVVGADFAGFPLKETVCDHLRSQGWKILDLGVTKESAQGDTELMFHRVGLRVGAEISEGNYERGLLFCGTGMGIHIAASKCPRVLAGVVESVVSARRAATANGVNVLAMGAFYIGPQKACDMVDAYLSATLGSDQTWWKNFYRYHKIAVDELTDFDYEEYKRNGFHIKHLDDCDIELQEKPVDKFYVN